MRKVVIISYTMIPYASTLGSCQRIFFLAEEMYRQGIDVSVICRKKVKKTALGQKPKFNIYAIDKKGSIESVELGKNESYNSNNINKYKKNTIKKYVALILCGILKIRFNDVDAIEGYRSWRWTYTSLDVIDKFIKEKQANCVIITAPPFGIYRLTRALRSRNKNISIFLDYRDPWNSWKKGSCFSNRKEKEALYACTKVTVTTAELREDLIKRYSIPENKVTVIGNGFSEKDWIGMDIGIKKEKSYVFSFVGSISIENPPAYRNPKKIINSFLSVMSMMPEAELLFVGVFDICSDYVKAIEERSLGRIRFLPSVSQEESYQYMLDADCLLQIHTATDDSGKYLISGKVYDYIRAGKFILAVGGKEDAVHELLISLQAGILVENEEEAIKEALLDIYQNRPIVQTLEKGVVQKYSREYQNRKWISEVL